MVIDTANNNSFIRIATPINIDTSPNDLWIFKTFLVLYVRRFLTYINVPPAFVFC